MSDRNASSEWLPSRRQFLGGAAGVVAERPYVIAGAAISLFVLGLTQATLWLFVLPTAGVLGAASVLVAFHERTVVTG